MDPLESIAGSKLPAPSSMQVVTYLRYLVEAVDAKDPYTAGHSHRVAGYALHIFDRMLDAWPEKDRTAQREQLLVAALLHDIGKIRMPDAVLKKPGAFTPMERLEMELHPAQALDILGKGALVDWIGPIIRGHHEKLDGTGYPDNLSGDEIPLLARIISVADVFDAITSKRIYRENQKKFDDKAAFDILRDSAAKGAVDSRAVEALYRAHCEGQVFLTRSAFYAGARNASVTLSANEVRTPYQIAREALKDALSFRDNPAARFSAATNATIVIRLATIANLEGASEEALATLDLLPPAERPLAQAEPGAALQAALALRRLKRHAEARPLALDLAATAADQRVRAMANCLLAEIEMDLGRFDAVDAFLDKAREAVIEAATASAYGTHPRTLIDQALVKDADELEVIRCRIEAIDLRKLRRLCDARVARKGVEVAEAFELAGERTEAGYARTQLAIFLGDVGEFDKAVFLLERERQHAKEMGDVRYTYLRGIWLAMILARRAACAPDVELRIKLLGQFLTLVDEVKAITGHATDFQRDLDACKVKALAYWYCGMNAEALTQAHALGAKLATLPGRREGYADASDLAESALISDVIEAVCGSETPDPANLLVLAERAHKGCFVPRELEILASILLQGTSPEGATARGRFDEIATTMGGRCWVQQHPRGGGFARRRRPRSP